MKRAVPTDKAIVYPISPREKRGQCPLQPAGKPQRLDKGSCLGQNPVSGLLKDHTLLRCLQEGSPHPMQA